MPNCFTLTRKGETEPAFLQQIDRELCQNLSLPFDDEQWTNRWYDIIGLSLALGASLPSLIDRFQANERTRNLYRIACYLNEHYVANAWAERR